MWCGGRVGVFLPGVCSQHRVFGMGTSGSAAREPRLIGDVCVARAVHGADSSGPAPAPHVGCPPRPSPAPRACRTAPAPKGSSTCQGSGRGTSGSCRKPCSACLHHLADRAEGTLPGVHPCCQEPGLPGPGVGTRRSYRAGQRRARPWKQGSGCVLRPQAPSSRCPCPKRARSPGAAWAPCP